ncbi:hypothetical protein [Sandaracinus amylolyticus]|uniref:hypothetical protein n=1 Tax=Sandaracinus amylolyticus TaxID=927083 RepID=UPI001F3190E8|nr:hypothetical protein [Sandaracinus amylolyticus]UJR86370.1 Hypothetical protein I5071_84640 [Sandaracinus amylolyticus]
MRNRALLALVIGGLLALAGCGRGERDEVLSEEHREDPGALTPTERQENVHVPNELDDPEMTHTGQGEDTPPGTIDPGTYPPGSPSAQPQR